jgi:formylglycine-generating enzyme required for sulfatase activity
MTLRVVPSIVTAVLLVSILQDRADTLTLPPSADTTLFETFPTNNLGAADLTSGSTAGVLRSRALIKFDLAGRLPIGADLQSVTLTLIATRQPSGGTPSNYRLFRLLRPWAEGNKPGTHGAPADPGETTWNDRFAYEPGGSWSVPGAAAPVDFSPTVSASTFVSGQGPVPLADSGMATDVQFWLQNPTNNFGWILISDAEDIPQTVTHFASREDPTNAPLLRLEFKPPVGAQVPKIAGFNVASNAFNFTFLAEPTQTYTVQFLPSLSGTNWQPLVYFPAPSAVTNHVVSDPISSPARFYRLQSSLAPNGPSNMVFIPPGTFWMGSPTNEVDRTSVEGPQTLVTVSRGFWIGKYHVTQGEYESVVGTNPSHFTGDPTLPVEQVSWFDATNYCGKLTEQERAAGRISTNALYRLPTEAEWEYACRAWTTTRFSYGDDPGYTNLAAYAWYADNSGAATHPVGQKLPNPWGLYDMHGNVLNWCQDWWGTYPGGSLSDPQGPTTGSLRVIRGGSWLRTAAHCRSAFRHYFAPNTTNILIGFRVVLSTTQ